MISPTGGLIDHYEAEKQVMRREPSMQDQYVGEGAPVGDLDADPIGVPVSLVHESAPTFVPVATSRGPPQAAAVPANAQKLPLSAVPLAPKASAAAPPAAKPALDSHPRAVPLATVAPAITSAPSASLVPNTNSEKGTNATKAWNITTQDIASLSPPETASVMSVLLFGASVTAGLFTCGAIACTMASRHQEHTQQASDLQKNGDVLKKMHKHHSLNLRCKG
jgi:hypothetical protein